MPEPSPHDLAREARLSRDLRLADREDATADDLRDCAVVLVKAGFAEAADLLFDVASLAVGDLEAGRLRLRGGTTWDLAVDELSGLIAATEGLPDVGSPEPDALEEAAAPAAGAPDRRWLETAFGPALQDLLRLRAPGPRGAEAHERAMNAAELIEDARRYAPIEHATAAREPAGLATAVAFNTARRVLIRRGELARPPYGDPWVFAAAERLSAFGLGLGFRNVGVLAPTWPEIELLIEEAWRKTPRGGSLEAAIDRFTVLLSMGLSPSAARDLIDDLADAGRTRILAGILIGLRRQPVDIVDKDLLRTIRDGFLDLDGLPFAVAAQTRLTVASGHNDAEVFAQAELEASLRNRIAMTASAGTAARPARLVVRRSGFGGDAARRARRFRQALEQRADMSSAPTMESVR
jgi:hypothetical protein